MALLLGLAACGGDSDEAPGAGESDAAKAEDFRNAVDAICVDNAIRINQAAERYGLAQSFDEAGDYEAGRAESSDRQAAAAAVLEPPADLAADYQSFVANLEQYADISKQRAAYALAGQRADYEATGEQLGGLGNEQTDLAADLGLQACARELAPESDGALREVTVRVLTGAEPERSCAEDVTANFRAVNTGRGKNCVASLEALNEDGSEVEYLFSTGVDEVVASANVEIATVAGAKPRYVIYDFLWDEQAGTWRIDSAFAPGGPAPEPESETSAAS